MISSTPVHVEYQFTMMEWREAVQAGPHPPSRYSTFGWLICIALAFALAAVVHHSHAPPAMQRALDSFLQSTPATLILCGLVLGLPCFFVIRQLRGVLRDVKGHWQQLVTLDLDDQAVRISIGVGSTRWRWEEFAALFETERLLLLRLKSTEAVVPIPKRVLSEAQIEQVRQLAAVNSTTMPRC